MSRIGLIVIFAIWCLVISSCIPSSECSKKPVEVARKEDIPFIKCQVCEKLAAQLYHQYMMKQSQISPKKVSELQIIEMAENVCNLKMDEADWIMRLDIVEKGDTLELVEQNSVGQCNSECKTIEKACQEVMGYSDTDVAEYIYKAQPQIDSLITVLCKDLTKACSTKLRPLPKDRIPGEAFVPKSSKEAEMDRLMKSMQGMPGAPGMKMYSRDDLMNTNKFGKDDDDDDDEDDEDDDERFPSNLGKILSEKEEKKSWKEKMTKMAMDAGTTLKMRAQRLNQGVQNWYKRAKKGASIPNKKSKVSKSEL